MCALAIIYTTHTGNTLLVIIYTTHTGSTLLVIIYTTHTGNTLLVIIYTTHTGSTLLVIIYTTHTGSPQLEVGTDHPDVLAAVEEEAKSVRVAEFPITVEMYMTALKRGIDQARTRTKQVDPGGTRYIIRINLYNNRTT